MRLLDDEFLTVGTVAETLKLNQQTVRNWIDRGELPAIRIGPRRVRIRRSDLDQLLSAGATNVQRRPESAEGAEESTGQPWAEFVRRMNDAHGSIAAESHTDLAAALRSFSRAASRLADALDRPTARAVFPPIGNSGSS